MQVQGMCKGEPTGTLAAEPHIYIYIYVYIYIYIYPLPPRSTPPSIGKFGVWKK